MRSATCSTSGRRWLTYTMPTPRPASSRIKRCKRATSSWPSAVVGSSSNSTFGSESRACTTSSIWRWVIDSDWVGVWASTSSW